jgi:signal peptidase II
MLRRASFTLGLAGLVLALDQMSKSWAMKTLVQLGREGITVIPGCFQLAYAENRNAAFGILQMLPYELRRAVLTGFAIVAILVLLGALFTNRIQRTWTAVASGLILGGAIGNVIDRARLGYVVDFIVWHVRDKFYWPTFNVADSGIVVGVFTLLWISYYVEKRELARGTGPVT